MWTAPAEVGCGRPPVFPFFYLRALTPKCPHVCVSAPPPLTVTQLPLTSAQPNQNISFTMPRASPEGPALRLTRLDDMLIITLEGDVSYCLRMHSVERGMSYLCQTGGGRGRGGMEEEREEGDITKLHLKLGLSPLDSPSTLSLAFLGSFGAQARFFNRSEKRGCCVKEIIVKVLPE